MDLLVVIPSYNSAATIAYVVSQAARGLEEYFGGRGSILVSDGGSTDGTRGVVEALRLGVEVVFEEYPGPPGKGSAVLHGFRRAVEGGYGAVVMLDSDLRSVEPYWVGLLGRAARGYDLVTPLYARHRHDGTITKTLAYPAAKSVLGLPVRQPIGGDFGVSARLARELLERARLFEPAVHRFGIDFFITSTAAAVGARVAEADLGTKLHAPKDPGKHLKGMFEDVAATVWRAITLYYGRGRRAAVDRLSPGETWRCPQLVRVDVDTNIARFLSEYQKARDTLVEIMGRDALAPVAEALRERRRGAYPDGLWAETVYRHVAAFASQGEAVLGSFYAAWLGKVSSYILDTLETDEAGAEQVVEGIAAAFADNISLLEELLGAEGYGEKG